MILCIGFSSALDILLQIIRDGVSHLDFQCSSSSCRLIVDRAIYHLFRIFRHFSCHLIYLKRMSASVVSIMNNLPKEVVLMQKC